MVLNHWYFDVRHVSFNPPGELVHIVQPDSHYTVFAGPAQIHAESNLRIKNDLIIKLLLQKFVHDLERGPEGEALFGAP